MQTKIIVVTLCFALAVLATGCPKKNDTPPPTVPTVSAEQTSTSETAEASITNREKCPAGKYTSGEFSPEITIPLDSGRSILVCGNREGSDGTRVHMSEFDMFIKGLDPEPRLFFSASAQEDYNIIALPNDGVELESLLYLPLDESGAKTWVAFTKFKFKCDGVGCAKMPDECALGSIDKKIHAEVVAQTQAKVAGQAGSDKFDPEKLLPQLLVRALMGDAEAGRYVNTFDAVFHTDGDLSEEVMEAKAAVSRSVGLPCRFKQ